MKSHKLQAKAHCTGGPRSGEERKYRNSLNRDVIKYIAMLTMLLNHIAHVFLVPGTFLYEVFVDMGYFTAITMCYFLVEGYGYTRSRRNYMLRLLAFAAISQLPFCLAFTQEGILRFCGMNMMFTLLLCFLMIVIVREPDLLHLKGIGYGVPEGYRKFLILLLVLASLVCDWPVFAPAFTLMFLRDSGFRERLIRDYMYAAAAFGISVFFENMARLSLLPNVLCTLGAMAAIGCSGFCILYLYNGRRMERGRRVSKWFFYLFYPVHLLVLGLMRVCLMD